MKFCSGKASIVIGSIRQTIILEEQKELPSSIPSAESSEWHHKVDSSVEIGVKSFSKSFFRMTEFFRSKKLASSPKNNKQTKMWMSFVRWSFVLFATWKSFMASSWPINNCTNNSASSSGCSSSKRSSIHRLGGASFSPSPCPPHDVHPRTEKEST